MVPLLQRVSQYGSDAGRCAPCCLTDTPLRRSLMRSTRMLALVLLALPLMALTGRAPARSDDHQDVLNAIAAMTKADSGLAKFLKGSAGYAVFPTIGKGAIGIADRAFADRGEHGVAGGSLQELREPRVRLGHRGDGVEHVLVVIASRGRAAGEGHERQCEEHEGEHSGGAHKRPP